jgi:hypothetical protein
MGHKRLYSVLIFFITITIVIVVLSVLNWVPTAIQKDSLRRYDSIAEIESTLQIKEIYVPSYFPQSLTWPPSEIIAQKKPFTAIIMAFEQVESGEVALVISQAAEKDYIAEKKIKLSHITEKVSYPLKGRTALLEVGTCQDGRPCSQISWDEGDYTIQVGMTAAPFEMVKIAESMLK